MNIPISVTLKIFFAVGFVAAAVIAVAAYNLMRLASIAAAFKGIKGDRLLFLKEL